MAVELIGDMCLLTNRAPAYGLALLAPLMTVIALFHAILNPGGLPLAVVLVVCGALLMKRAKSTCASWLGGVSNQLAWFWCAFCRTAARYLFTALGGDVTR